MAYINIPSSSSASYKDPVASAAQLPAISSEGDIRLTLDTGELYYYDGASWQSITSGGGGSADTVTYSPTVPSDWTTAPTNVEEALDELAARTIDTQYHVEKFTLDAGQIAAKSVILSVTPTTANLTNLLPIGGSAQDYGVDFTVSGTTFSWNGLGLDGVLEVGDKLIIIYN